MSESVKMPALGESVTEGTVTTWFDLNNSGKSSVSVTYGTEDGKFTVKNSYGSQK